MDWESNDLILVDSSNFFEPQFPYVLCVFFSTLMCDRYNFKSLQSCKSLKSISFYYFLSGFILWAFVFFLLYTHQSPILILLICNISFVYTQLEIRLIFTIIYPPLTDFSHDSVMRDLWELFTCCYEAALFTEFTTRNFCHIKITHPACITHKQWILGVAYSILVPSLP